MSHRHLLSPIQDENIQSSFIFLSARPCPVLYINSKVRSGVRGGILRPSDGEWTFDPIGAVTIFRLMSLSV